MGKKKKIPSDVYAFMRELIDESLRDWFKKEKWVRITTAGNIAGPCGTSKNTKNPDRCLPKAKAQSLTKAQRAATAQKKKKAGSKGKTVVKNTKKATVSKESANPQDGKAAPYGSGYGKVTKEDITNLVVGLIHEAKGKEVLTEKDDRCTRIAKRKYDTWPSAYASGAVVRCRRGDIWKNEQVEEILNKPKVQLITNITYLKDLVKINIFSEDIRRRLNSILSNAEGNNNEVTLNQLDFLKKHLKVDIKIK